MPNLSEQLNAISSSNHFEKTTKNRNTNKKSNDIVIDIPCLLYTSPSPRDED